jgi:hypothetical protein
MPPKNTPDPCADGMKTPVVRSTLGDDSTTLRVAAVLDAGMATAQTPAAISIGVAIRKKVMGR